MKTKITSSVSTVLGLAALIAPMFLARSAKAAENVSPTPSPGMWSSLPRPDFHFPGNVGRHTNHRNYDNSAKKTQRSNETST